MTERERFNVSEMKSIKWAQQAGRCYFCGRDLNTCHYQLAHRIPQKKWAVKKYGKEIIHHRLNMVLTCAPCNYKAAVGGIEIDFLANEIKEALGNER